MKALPYPLSAWAIVDESYSILYGHENWKMDRLGVWTVSAPVTGSVLMIGPA